MNRRIILSEALFGLTCTRLCHQLIENHKEFTETILLGVQPRGVRLAQELVRRIQQVSNINVPFGKIDISFHRDDFRESGRKITVNQTDIKYSLEDKRIVLIDDVLYTGRTIRAALEAMLSFGRPKDVELLVMIDRKLHRHLPIQAKYTGKVVDSISAEKVRLDWQNDEKAIVWLEKERNDNYSKRLV